MRAPADIVHLLTLDMHAAHQHGFRPFEIFRRRFADILVDEADRPMLGQIGRDQQQPLWGHKRLDAGGQWVGILERAKRRRIAWKDAQNAPHVPYALSSHPSSSATTNL